eukprot:9487441-Pyramimonas_sp.AAC.3
MRKEAGNAVAWRSREGGEESSGGRRGMMSSWGKGTFKNTQRPDCRTQPPPPPRGLIQRPRAR